MRAVGDGYFGAGASAELDRLESFDHLHFHPLLQRRGCIFDLPAPPLELMRRAMSDDRPVTHATTRPAACGEPRPRPNVTAD